MYTQAIENELDKWEWHIAGANRHGDCEDNMHLLLTRIWQALYFATHSQDEETNLYKEGAEDVNVVTNATEALGYINPYVDHIKSVDEFWRSNDMVMLQGKLKIALEEIWRVDKRRTKRAYKSVHDVCMKLKTEVIKEWAFYHLKDPVCT